MIALPHLSNPNPSELEDGAVAEKSNVAGRPRQARMLRQHVGFFHRVQIGIDDDHAVQSDADAPAVGSDLFAVPFACRLEIAGARRDHVVDRSVMLLRSDLALVAFVAIVEDLDLHALVGGIAFERRADTDAVVAAWLGPELEAEDEVGVLANREQVAATVRGTDDGAIANQVAGTDAADEAP